MQAVKTAIECADCGGDLQSYVTLGALLIAALALAMNFVQFREFLRGMRARAEFAVTLTPVSDDVDGVRRTKAGKSAVRVAIGIKNSGRKAANETLINALVPRHLELVRWCGPNGEQLDESEITTKTAEKLVAPDGTEYEVKYLSRTLPRVGTKPHHLVHFQFYVEIPKPGEIIVPVRVKVQADEIPDDVEDYIADLNVRVQRLPP